MNTLRQDTDNKSFFTKVDTQSGAIAMSRVAAKVFAVVGVLQFAMALFAFSTVRSPAIFFDCIVNLVCAFYIYRFHSRVASLAALTLATMTLLFTLIAGFGGFAIIFSLLAIWAGGRALEATVKLHGSLASPPNQAFTLKNLAIALSVVISGLLAIYFVAVLPPSRSEQKMIRYMQADILALLNRDRVKILQEGQVARFGFISMGAIVSQQGWGTVLKPGTEQLLADRRWRKYQGRNDVYCRDGVQLSFTQTMYQNTGAVMVNMVYNHMSQKDCKTDRGP